MRWICFMAWLTLLPATASAQPVQLTPPAQRISDAAIYADTQGYQKLQGRIQALNERGLGVGPKVSDYHLAKAQCWLDVSFHEYSRNDRSDFPQAALDQSQRLIVLMEDKAAPLPDDTPLVNDADRLRPDLWAAIDKLRAHAGWRCAAAKAACAGVELVHAGNEHKQIGWRHAKPYVQMAEDLVAEGQRAAEACIPPPAPPPPPPVVVPVPPQPQALNQSASLYFSFAESDATSIRPDSRVLLDRLIETLRQPGFTTQSIKIIGHADRLNATGQPDFNLQLSLRRAQTVADLLTAAGVSRSIMTVEGRSDDKPVQDCKDKGKDKSMADLEDCLAPNRRVEVELTGLKLP